MDLISSLLIWLGAVVTVFILALKYRISKWSALALSLLVGIIVLSLIFPISSVERVAVQGPYIYIYTIIQIVTVFVLLWYLIYSIFHDRDCIMRIYNC